MAGYSGTASFEFEIERYKDRESGLLLTEDKVPTDDDFEYEYQLIKLNIEGRAYYQPGRTWGPPENCYPDEGETELTAVRGPDGKDWEDQLTKREMESVLEMIQDQSSSDDGCDYEPDYEYDE